MRGKEARRLATTPNNLESLKSATGIRRWAKYEIAAVWGRDRIRGRHPATSARDLRRENFGICIVRYGEYVYL